MGADRHRVERRQQPRHVLLPLSGPAHTGLACANCNPRVPHLALRRRRPAADANPRVRPRPRTAGDDRRVLPHGADAARSVRGARPRELREDLGLERPAALRPAQHQGHLRRDQGRVERSRSVFRREASRPSRAQAAEGAAYGTRADRLEPERPVQNHHQRLLAACAGPTDGLDSRHLGRGREMPEGQGPEPPGIRLRAGAEARRQARGPLRARDQEEAEAAEIAAPGHRRHTGDREDGQPAAQRRRPAISAAVSIRRPRVVIAGAGFAGPTCARGLKGAQVDVLLVDRNNYHLFTPLLYQVASSVLDPGEIARPVRQLIRPLRNADFLLANVTGADFEKRLLLTDHGALSYDYLVLATGSQSDYFGKASLSRLAFGLKNLDEGLAVRNRILMRFEESRWTKDREQRRSLLTFAVVGGGPTGVEMAGALSELINLVLRKDYRDLDLDLVRVVLLEAAGSLLGSFAPPLRDAARRSLERKGVAVLFTARLEDVSAGAVQLPHG